MVIGCDRVVADRLLNLLQIKLKGLKIMSKIIPNNITMKLQLLASDGNDDSLEDKILKLQEQLDKMNDVISENEKLKNTNEMLFNKNQEYFLKITGNVKEEEDINEFEEFVGKDFYDKLSNKEKKQLKTILEGEDE